MPRKLKKTSFFDIKRTLLKDNELKRLQAQRFLDFLNVIQVHIIDVDE